MKSNVAENEKDGEEEPFLWLEEGCLVTTKARYKYFSQIER